MKTGDSIKALADVVSTLEAAEYDVTTVAPIDESVVVDGAVETNLRVELPSPSVLEDTDGVEVVPREAALTDDGDVSLSLDLQVSEEAVPVVDEAIGEEDRDDASGRTAEGDTKGDTDNTDDDTHVENAVPAYRDPDRLRAAYEASDTFAEMTHVLDVDVTPQTVRKYAVRHGVHEVASAEGDGDDDPKGPKTGTSGTEAEDADAGSGPPPARTPEDGPVDAASGSDRPETLTDPTDTEDASGGTTDADASPDGSADGAGEVARSDGVGLPAGTTLDAVVAAVRDGKTVFDVQRRIGTDRDETRTLLERLDLLELVHGRATETAGETSVEEIRARVDAATGER